MNPVAIDAENWIHCGFKFFKNIFMLYGIATWKRVAV